MAFDAAFSPRFPFVTIVTVANTSSAATQIGGLAGASDVNANFRFKWDGTAPVTVYYDNSYNVDGSARTLAAATAPTAGISGRLGFTLLPSTVEVFTLPARLRIVAISTAVGNLEIVQGDGL